MTAAPEVTTIDDATPIASSAAVRQPPLSAVTACRIGKVFAKSAAYVVAVAVMWLIVLAIITVG